jgi:hypothetical protein
MATRRMADNNDPGQVEVLLPSKGPKVINSPRNILEGPRITSADMADAPIFEIPDNQTSVPKVSGQIVHQLKSRQVGLPASAVNQHHHRPWLR